MTSNWFRISLTFVLKVKNWPGQQEAERTEYVNRMLTLAEHKEELARHNYSSYSSLYFQFFFTHFLPVIINHCCCEVIWTELQLNLFFFLSVRESNVDPLTETESTLKIPLTPSINQRKCKCTHTDIFTQTTVDFLVTAQVDVRAFTRTVINITERAIKHIVYIQYLYICAIFVLLYTAVTWH